MKYLRTLGGKNLPIVVLFLAILLSYYVVETSRGMFQYNWRSMKERVTKESVLAMAESYKGQKAFDGAPLNLSQRGFVNSVKFICRARCNSDNFIAFPHVPMFYRWTSTISALPTVMWLDVTSKSVKTALGSIDYQSFDYIVYADLDNENFIGQEAQFNKNILLKDRVVDIVGENNKLEQISFMASFNAFVREGIRDGNLIPLFTYENVYFLVKKELINDNLSKMNGYNLLFKESVSSDKPGNVRIRVGSQENYHNQNIGMRELKRAYDLYRYQGSLYYVLNRLKFRRSAYLRCLSIPILEAIQIESHCRQVYSEFIYSDRQAAEFIVSYLSHKNIHSQIQ